MLLGPVIGSLLYAIGGFKLPFLVVGGVLLMYMIILGLTLAKDTGEI